MMVFINEAYKAETLPKVYAEGFAKLLSPVAPHLAEELWEKLGHGESITYATWPAYDEGKLVDDEIEVIVQVNGKLRGKVTLAKDATKQQMEEAALGTVQTQIEGKNNPQNYCGSGQAS
ncbi:hypothetical protein GCM10020331_030810 [Ectobacillus funiculus]